MRVAGRQKSVYIKGRNLFLWARFEARSEEADLSHSDALAEAVELWLGVHGEPKQTPLFYGDGRATGEEE